MNTKWEDNSVQFPRLICEIVATQEIDFEMLAISMDLTPADLHELLNRAHEAWEQAKEQS